MPSTTRPDRPRHMAGRGSKRPAAPRLATAPTLASDAGELELASAVRVHRSRLAVALATTIAAVPILVLDNFPATADTSEDLEVSTTVEETSSIEVPDSTTSTAVAPVLPTAVLAAIETTTTTAAPTTATTAAPLQALSAPQALTPTPPTTADPPPPPPAPGDPDDPATWDQLAQCEASGNWSANTGNGYYGGLQFSLSTWESYGGTGYPHEASKTTQIEVGKRLHAARGWDAWPSCARELGYR